MVGYEMASGSSEVITIPPQVSGVIRIAITAIVDQRASSQLIIEAGELIVAYRKFNDRVLDAKSRVTEGQLTDLLELVETTERSLEVAWDRYNQIGAPNRMVEAFASAIRRLDSAIRDVPSVP